MFEMFAKWEVIEQILRDSEVEYLQPLTCMMIDYVAAKSGMSSKELLDSITPIIIKCNEELGAIEV